MQQFCTLVLAALLHGAHGSGFISSFETEKSPDAPPNQSIFSADSALGLRPLAVPPELGQDQVLLRREQMGSTLYLGKPNPDNWRPNIFYRIPDSLPAMAWRHLYTGPDARQRPFQVAFTRGWFTNGTGGTLYYFRDSADVAPRPIDPEPLAPSLLRIDCAPTCYVSLDGGPAFLAPQWRVTDRPLLELRLRAPGHLDRIERVLVHPGQTDTLAYSLFPVEDGDLEQLATQVQSWFQVSRSLGGDEIAARRRDLIGLKDSVSARHVRRVAAYLAQNPIDGPMKGESKADFKRRRKVVRSGLEAMDRSAERISRRCDSSLALLASWRPEAGCERDSLTWIPDQPMDSILKDFKADFGTARVDVTFKSFPAWFYFNGGVSLDERQYFRLRNAWGRSVVFKAFLWRNAQADAHDSAWLAGFDELRIGLGAESIRADGRFKYPKVLLAAPAYAATMAQVESRRKSCLESGCHGFWGCYWPWILAGGGAAATAAYIGLGEPEKERELKTYEVKIRFEDTQ